MLRKNHILLKLPLRILYSILFLLFLFNTESFAQQKKTSHLPVNSKTKITPKPTSKINSKTSTTAKNKTLSKSAIASKYKTKKIKKTNEDVSLKNIYKRIPSSIFRENQNIIEPKNLVILDSIAVYLLQNPQIKMEIGVHTDTRWDDENNAFTEKRSKVICDYLEYKGVSRTRLSYKGYGKTQPLITDVMIKRMKSEKSKELAHLKNRRIEFKMISN